MLQIEDSGCDADVADAALHSLQSWAVEVGDVFDFMHMTQVFRLLFFTDILIYYYYYYCYRSLAGKVS